MDHTISIIMPAYNEGENIFENIRTTHEVIHEAGLNAVIIVVDDGSSDNTLEEIERAVETFDNVSAARNSYNMGKGMALRTGFDHADGDIVVFLDADLDLHPSQIQNLLAELEKGSYDVVVTSKHHPESKLAYPLKRKVSSYIYYMIVRILFGLPVRDTQTGLKIFRREVLDNIFHRLLVKTYAYDVELLATAVRFGYRIHEVPVVLDFKRGLDWGRIQVSDVMKIFVDTLAIFYRLRILRYYDAERPPWPQDEPPVLVVAQGAPPTEDIIKRVSIDTNILIACLAEKQENAGVQPDSLSFSSLERLEEWLVKTDANIEIVGFLGSGCIPLGSWVKNALRNFRYDEIKAVCGPVVPGHHVSFPGKVATMLYASFLTSGPNNYLYDIRRLKYTGKGLVDNVFLRISSLNEKEFTFHKGVMYKKDPSDHVMKYDPDVAVSKSVPPLFLPYMRHVAREAFEDGYTFLDRHVKNNRLWICTPFILWLIIILGWMIMPGQMYGSLIFIYLLIILFSGILYFDPVSLPVYIVGMLLDHFVRALAFPAGVGKRLTKRG